MSSKLVLVVEDELAIGRLIAILVKEIGAEADTAGNGAEALQKIAKAKPDLVVVDLIMPVMTGEELIQEIQGNPDLSDIPIVLLTTRQSAAGYKKGEFPLISKPFEPAEAKEILKRALGL